MAKRQKGDMIKKEARRQRRIVNNIGKGIKEHNVEEHLQALNHLQESNSKIMQDLNKMKVNIKRKKTRYEANTKRLKASLVVKEKIFCEKDREIEITRKTAEKKQIHLKENLEKKYEEAKILEEEYRQQQLIDVKSSYDKRLQYKTSANVNLNDKLKRSRINATQLKAELKQVKDTYSDTRQIRLEARKIKANTAIIISKGEKYKKGQKQYVNDRGS